jgi:hypothetical protein
MSIWKTTQMFHRILFDGANVVEYFFCFTVIVSLGNSEKSRAAMPGSRLVAEPQECHDLLKDT